MSITQEFTHNTHVTLRELGECSKRIFNKYLQCHLAPPDGCRQSSIGELEEIEDNEDNDRIHFRDQLQAIGQFGRLVPDHSLPVLFKYVSLLVNLLLLRLTINHIEQPAENTYT